MIWIAIKDCSHCIIHCQPSALTYSLLRIENGIARVEDSHGLPPSIPFWLGEGAGRTTELSQSVFQLRQQIADKLLELDVDHTIEWVVKNIRIPGQAAVQLVEYLAATQAALKGMPTQEHIFSSVFLMRLAITIL